MMIKIVSSSGKVDHFESQNSHVISRPGHDSADGTEVDENDKPSGCRSYEYVCSVLCPL